MVRKNYRCNGRDVNVIRLITLLLTIPFIFAALLTVMTSTNYASLLFDLVLPASLRDGWISFVSYIPDPAFPDMPANRLYAVIVRVASAIFLMLISTIPLVSFILFKSWYFKYMKMKNNS